jgi:glyoxylase-like metal-dependent hydrolase (beta-lactamase superfamily II)
VNARSALLLLSLPLPLLLPLLLVLPPLALGAQQARPAPTTIDVAEGVYLFTSEPYGDVGLDGNSVAIVASDGVLVFDSNGTPAGASAVLAEIRKRTDAPVRYVVNSHWHWDHWYGTEVYREAYPRVKVVTQEKTREMMLGPALEFNRPGLETQLPAYIESLRQRVSAAEATTPPPADLQKTRDLLAADRFFLEQKTGVHHVAADVTFRDRLDIHLGDREIEVLHYDRAVTPGDTFLYLPKEKILITGDLLVNPISFALSCYPTGWLRTLERMDALDVAVLVPGHGEPVRDRELLHATMGVFRELLRQGKQAREKGLAVDDAKTAILPSLAGYERTITGGDAALSNPFRIYLVDWYLHRVYDELDGPLSDAIAPIPRS